MTPESLRALDKEQLIALVLAQAEQIASLVARRRGGEQLPDAFHSIDASSDRLCDAGWRATLAVIDKR